MSTDLVTFDIVINGTPISSNISVISIEIDKNETVSNARIEIDANAEEWPLVVSNEFKLGLDIEIRLGYNNTNNSAFKGIITDRGVRLSQGSGVKNVFICEGKNEFEQASITLNPEYVYNIDLGYDGKNNVEGGVEAQGSLEYTAGSTINFDNVVEGFPKGTVHSVMHEVSNGNWFSSLHFIKPEEEAEPTTKPATAEAEAKTTTTEPVTTATENKMVQNLASSSDKDITISDANGNSITLSSSGIEIKSSKNITLSADQNISIKGNMGVTQVASGGDVTIKGLNTKINADMGATINGSITTTVEAGTELTLKGAMVMIN